MIDGWKEKKREREKERERERNEREVSHNLISFLSSFSFFKNKIDSML